MSTIDPTADAALAPRPDPRPVRPFYWSVRRELWENRSIVVTPVAIAGVILIGLLIAAARLASAQRMGEVAHYMSGNKATDLVALPYEAPALIVMVTAFIVGFFYCLSALSAERRDRSILFWKSMPVSDAVTVLAKATVPLVVLPMVTFVVVVVTQIVVMAVGAGVLFVANLPAASLWTSFPLGYAILGLAYSLVVLSLWYAPIVGWLLLVSGWAKRAPILWAVGAPTGLAVFERVAFGSSYVSHAISDRMSGGLRLAFASTPGQGFSVDPSLMTPLRLLASPDLWAGLVIAAALIAGAIWQRRYRAPL